MTRRRAMSAAACAALLAAPGAARAQLTLPADPPGPSSPPRGGNAPGTDLEGWWARQREREAADRFWNGPRDQRRNLTRDQIERWERDRDRRLWRPVPPF